jgi:tRNA A-37 threonylcarbamoyl transferase component Bud32
LVCGRWIPREALLVTEWLGSLTKWSRHLTGEVPRARSPDEHRHALRGLARQLGKLHRLGLYHGDLSANLVFAQIDGRDDPYLIDLEALSGRLSRKRRVKNLEELGRGIRDLRAVSLRDRWLFLKAYASAADLDVSEARRLWREGRRAQIVRVARSLRREGEDERS